MVEQQAPVREAVPARPGSDVFISYSRRDREVVERLAQALEARGRTAWVDWADIPPTAEWMAEIKGAIDASDTVVVVLSPDSARSPVCGEELEAATSANKRIVPVVVREVTAAEVPPELSKRSWLFLRETDDFEAGVDTLVETLDTDLEATRFHTGLLVKAREWEQAGELKSRLLRGSDLSGAESYVASPGKGPATTQEQTRFVLASRRAATRRQRTLVAGVSAALVISLALASVAAIQRSQAIRERNVARSRELAASSTQQLEIDPELSLLLGIEAADASPTLEAADSLRQALVASHLVATLTGHTNPLRDATFSPDGTRILTTSWWHKGIIGRPDAHDYTARLWDGTTGKQLLELEGHSKSISSAQFSPDSSKVMTVSQDGTARIWDARTGRALQVLDGLTGLRNILSPLRRASFSSDGGQVVGISQNGVTIWDVETGQQMLNLKTRIGHVVEAVYVPNRELVVGRWDRGFVLWDAESGEVMSTLEAPFPVILMAISADGSRLLKYEQKLWTKDLVMGVAYPPVER